MTQAQAGFKPPKMKEVAAIISGHFDYGEIMKILCILGLHDWQFYEEWYPSFDAPIITRWLHVITCRRCGKESRSDTTFSQNGEISTIESH